MKEANRSTVKGNLPLNFVKDRFFWLPALSAIMLGLSRYPLNLNFLVFFAFIPLLFLFERNKELPRLKIIKSALTFSTVYTIVALYWISVVTFPGFLGLFILFGFYFTVLFLIIKRIYVLLPRFRFLGLISVWLTFEWLKNFGEFRFPWFNLGYSLADYTALIQIAETGGVYLLSLLILIVNILLFRFLANFSSKKAAVSILAVIVIIVMWSSWGVYRLRTLPLQEEDFRASIVQVSIPQYIKWDEDFYNHTLEQYREYTLQAAATEPDLIIWPESAIPDYVLQSNRPKNYVLDLVDEVGIDLFLGLPHYEINYDGQYSKLKFYNATTLIDANGNYYQPYYKIFLVPFGERIPFMDYIPFLRTLEFGQANWEYGENLVHYISKTEQGNYLFSSLICFEIAFPGLTARIAADGVDFMINVTNDAWFKRTIGPYQHAVMTTIRAVETRTQIYRAANTGISMIVDPAGVIRKQTELFEKTTIEDKLYLYPGQTFYVRYMSGYPVIFFLIGLGLLAATFIRKPSSKRSVKRKA